MDIKADNSDQSNHTLIKQEEKFKQIRWHEFNSKKSFTGNSKRLTFTTIFSATPTVVAAMIGWTFVPWFLKQQVLNKIVISQSASPDMYNAWIHPPFPIYFKVYLFNVTNPDEVQSGALPKLQEIGPYVFRENRTKLNIIYDDKEDTATYAQYMSYHFEKDQSGSLSLSDTITILNVPYVAAAIKIDDLPWPVSTFGRTILLGYEEPLFIEKTVGEILFEGWKVPFLQSIEDDLGISLIPNNTFAVFANQNDTLQGPFTISRGTYDKFSFGQTTKYKNQRSLNVWSDTISICNEVKGTDGTIFPPLLNTTATLRIFITEFCQSLKFNYVGDVKHGKIKAYRFSPRNTIQKKPLEHKEDDCFCNFPVQTNPEKCLKQGVFDVGPCRDGAPIAVSAPHFLDADEEYIRNSGLKPDREKHESVVDMEPLTGILLHGSKKIQINLILRKVKGMTSLKKVPEILFPLVWADEFGTINESLLNRLEDILFKIGLLEFALKWPFLGFVFLTTLIWHFNKVYKKTSSN